MTHQEAKDRIVKLTPEVKGKVFRHKISGNLTKVEDLTARTKENKNLNVLDNWDIYAVIERKKISEGWYDMAEIKYSIFIENFDKQD